LPTDIRKKLDTALADATRFNNSNSQRESAEAMEAIRKTGMTTIYKPTSKELDQWRQVLRPVHKKMEDRIGKALLDAVYKDLSQKR
jgi:C4-dicarboxylate-binding protein DctP